MSVTMTANGSEDIRVIAGDNLVLRVSAYDPNGISKVFIQCFQFSLASSNKSKLAVGELIIPPDECFASTSFDIVIHIPQNAALGKWGVQFMEFTNGRGYKTAFYRGQGKFDNIIFDVIPPPSKEDELLRFYGVEIAGRDRCA